MFRNKDIQSMNPKKHGGKNGIRCQFANIHNIETVESLNHIFSKLGSEAKGAIDANSWNMDDWKFEGGWCRERKYWNRTQPCPFGMKQHPEYQN